MELCGWFYPLTWIVLLVVSYIDWVICAAMVLIVPPLLMFMHYTPSATQVQHCGVKMAHWCEPLPVLFVGPTVTNQVLDVTPVIPFLSSSLLVTSSQSSVIWHQAQKCHAPCQPSKRAEWTPRHWVQAYFYLKAVRWLEIGCTCKNCRTSQKLVASNLSHMTV